jgi:hypothetical protein
MSAKKKQHRPKKARRPARPPRSRPKTARAKGRSKSRPKAAGGGAKGKPKTKPKPKTKAKAAHQRPSAERQRTDRERERARLLKEREREQAKRERERELAAQLKQRAAEQRERERQKAEAARARKRAQQKAEQERAAKKRQQEREREAAQKAAQHKRAQEQKQRQQEREQTAKERAKLAKQRERERALAQKARERELAQKKAEQKKLAAQRERERAAELKAKAAEKQRQAEEKQRQREQERAEQKAERQRLKEEAKREREEERARILAEKEREREEARRIKEEERARKDAEREAYRRAKETERERLRAEREAARRALESRVARATRNAQRAAARGSTTRVYRPDAIPNQAGTTRRVDGHATRLGHLLGVPAGAAQPAASATGSAEVSELEVSEAIEQPPLPPLPPPVPDASEPGATATGDAAPRPISEEEQKRISLVERVAPEDQTDQRWAVIQERLARTADDFRREYRESFDMSWVYHDSALEGVVYTFQELKTAIDPNITVVPDSSLQPVCEEIRRHNAAIELVRELAEKKRVPITVDVVKRIYLTLHPEEGDLKSVKYRKDIPQHRLYFHEYAQPDKIAYKVRQVTDWLNGPEPKKLRSPVKIAARVHYDLLRTFPFPSDSGKVARLLANLILMRAGYPPAIIHSTERQRYYEALKGSLQTIVNLTNEAIDNGLQSIEKRLEDYEARLRLTV